MNNMQILKKNSDNFFSGQKSGHGLGGISLICLSRFAQRCLDYVPVVIVEGDVMLENLQVQNY